MLHPVGDLPASVYWRRRALVLAMVLAAFIGSSWLIVSVAGGGGSTPSATGPATATTTAATPALDQVLPSLASVQVPTVLPPTTTPPPSAPASAPETTAAATAAPPAGPVAGGPCTDDMIAVSVVTTPASAPAGSRATFDLVVTNTSTVPCVRTLDAGLQEIGLFDSTGARVWGSNDCYPGTAADQRTLAPGQAVDFPVTWSGLGSEPTCTAPRRPLPAGNYEVRARLDQVVSPAGVLTLV